MTQKDGQDHIVSHLSKLSDQWLTKPPHGRDAQQNGIRISLGGPYLKPLTSQIFDGVYFPTSALANISQRRRRHIFWDKSHGLVQPGGFLRLQQIGSQDRMHKHRTRWPKHARTFRQSLSQGRDVNHDSPAEQEIEGSVLKRESMHAGQMKRHAIADSLFHRFASSLLQEFLRRINANDLTPKSAGQTTGIPSPPASHIEQARLSRHS